MTDLSDLRTSVNETARVARGSLFLRLGRLSFRAGMLRAQIEEFERIERRKCETALLFPFEFLRLLMYRTSRETDKPKPPIRPILPRLAYENEKFGNIVPLLALVGLVVFIECHWDC